MKIDVWLVVPAYNAGKYLDTLLSQTGCTIAMDKTVVVNDGSSDDTSTIARKRKAHIIDHAVNVGKGKSLRAGIDFAVENGGEWVLTIDSDCQHDPAKVPDFISAAESGRFDLIIGNRIRKGSSMPWDRRLSNGLSSLIVSLVLAQKIDDAQCGFRMIRLDKLKNLRFSRNRYDFETEMLLKVARNGARIGWVRVPTRYNGEESFIRRFPDTLRFIKLIVLHLLHLS